MMIKCRLLIQLSSVAILSVLPVTATASTTPDLRIANLNPGTITLAAQSPGACGTWISTTSPAPPPSVAGSSTSAPFNLVVSNSCTTINVASMQYQFTVGPALFQCTYKIVGNSTFAYSASGNTPGCKYTESTHGQVDFVFPNVGGSRARLVRPGH
jgi:hypothetical protein